MAAYWTDSHCPVEADVRRENDREEGETWDTVSYRLRCTDCGRFFSSTWHAANRCTKCHYKASDAVRAAMEERRKLEAYGKRSTVVLRDNSQIEVVG